MQHRLLLTSTILFFVVAGCANPAPAPPDISPLPPPTIYVETPNGRVPMSPEEAAEYEASAPRTSVHADHRSDGDPAYGIYDPSVAVGTGRFPRFTDPQSLSRPKTQVDRFGPVYSQYYYVRPEHTPRGYIEGRYGRVDNYTPGMHAPHGYVPGNYRGDGALYYTRPEHTSTGYIPGHYRAEPIPFGQPTGASRLTPAAFGSPSVGPSAGR